MRDLEDEARIKEYMAAKMRHIKMYHECMNLADGLDVAKFAELVRADEREACAKVCEEEAKEAYHQEASYLPQGNPGLLRIAEGAKRCAHAIRARGEK